MIYTIGYAGCNIDRFVKILQDKKVDILIDVCSIPKSQYFKDFNNDVLNKTLSAVNIKYENWKYEFGARQYCLDFYTHNILDYEKFAQSRQFKNGVEKIKNLQFQNKTICLMCSEIDPINCHRAILCARELANHNLEVLHILAKRNGETFVEPQTSFEKRLIETTKPNTLEEAYKKQNKKIGYVLGS